MHGAGGAKGCWTVRSVTRDVPSLSSLGTVRYLLTGLTRSSVAAVSWCSGRREPPWPMRGGTRPSMEQARFGGVGNATRAGAKGGNPVTLPALREVVERGMEWG